MINGINHVALATHDLDRMVAWYRDVLGFEVALQTEWAESPLINSVIGVPNSAARQVMLRAGNVHIEVFQYLNPATPKDGPLRNPFDRGYTHICLDVSDIDAEHARLTAAGAVFYREPPHFEGGQIRAVYGRDPDGNIVEIQETLKEECGITIGQLPLVKSARPDAQADREEIRQGIHTYCRALDRCDEPLLRSVFTPNSEHHHGPYHGPSREFCNYAMAVLHELDGTSHHLSNVIIDLSGNVAHTEAYFLAIHLLGKGKTTTGLFASHDTSIEEVVEIGGRYIDRWEKRAGVWKIARRIGVHDWERWSKGDARGLPQMPADQRGRRDHSDPAYRRD